MYNIIIIHVHVETITVSVVERDLLVRKVVEKRPQKWNDGGAVQSMT